MTEIGLERAKAHLFHVLHDSWPWFRDHAPEHIAKMGLPHEATFDNPVYDFYPHDNGQAAWLHLQVQVPCKNGRSTGLYGYGAYDDDGNYLKELTEELLKKPAVQPAWRDEATV